MGSGIKDVTGIGAHACARHGCYCPGSVVNFIKGEGQKHMDFSLSEACQTTFCCLIGRLLHIYDLGCIYHKRLPKRFLEGRPFLTLPKSILETAIGMFHVHGHQDSCFFRYAPSFIKGAGMVDGEVLETLWSTLNSISPSLRTATLAHRSEVLDDHMNDSNWKKIISISELGRLCKSSAYVLLAATIIKKYKRAVENKRNSLAYFEDLSLTPTPEQLASWEAEISNAEAKRTLNPAAMDIMATCIPKGRPLLCDSHLANSHSSTNVS
jgi:hypothetical protein